MAIKVKKPLPILSSQTTYWIALLFCRNVPYIEVYKIPLDKNDPSKNIGFMGDSFYFYYAIAEHEFTQFLGSSKEDYICKITSLWCFNKSNLPWTCLKTV